MSALKKKKELKQQLISIVYMIFCYITVENIWIQTMKTYTVLQYDAPIFFLMQYLHLSIHDCQDEKALQNMLSSPEYDFQFGCGITTPSYAVKLSDKNTIISAICRHFAVYATLAELEQFKRGLQTLEFFDLVHKHPNLQQIFLPSEKKITPDFVQDFMEIIYNGDTGSNARVKEEAIAMNWINFLHDLPNDDDGENFAQEPVPTLKDVFVFVTGCESIPPLGFYGRNSLKNGTIEFDADAVVPTVSTCSLTLRLPTNLPSDYKLFKSKMSFYILSSQGFGQL